MKVKKRWVILMTAMTLIALAGIFVEHQHSLGNGHDDLDILRLSAWSQALSHGCRRWLCDKNMIRACYTSYEAGPLCL